MALRVALGLVVLLLAASPASAQFSTEDLNGPWILHGTRVGLQDAREAGWVQGPMFFLRSGALADDEVRDQGENLLVLRPGALTVSASGEVTGILNTTTTVRGQFTSFNLIVGVATSDARTPDETNTFFVLIRQPAAVFSQADATGTWRLSTLLVPAPPATTPEWVLGEIVVDGGTITGGELTSSNGSTTTEVGGSLFVNPDGTFNGQLDIGPAGADGTTFFGTFVPGRPLRDLMVGAASRSGEDRYGTFVLQQEPTPATVYGPADGAGTWELFSVQAVDGGTGAGGTWLRGTLVADGFGVVTGGTLTDGLGKSFTVDQGVIAVLSDGTVIAEVIFNSGLDLLLVQGSMLPSKTQIFGVDNFVGGLTPYLGFSTLVKPGPAGPAPAVVQFSQPAYTVTEGTPNAVITAVRTGTPTVPFTVTFTASPVTAVPGQDFTPVSGTLTFASGALSRTFNIPVVNNALVGGNRSVALNLGPPVGNAVLGSQAAAGLTILDNDQGGSIKLSSATYSVGEATASVVVTVMRTGTNLAGNVSVSYTTGNASALSGLDYTATAGVLTFLAGQTSRTVSIPILNDTLAEGNETFTFTLSDPSAGATLGVPAAAVITITDNEVVSTLKFSSASYSVNEGARNVTLTVVRSPATSSGVEVDFTTRDGTAISNAGALNDFTTTSGALSFGAGNASATIVISIAEDLRAEGNETFTVELSNPRGGAKLATPSTATVTIVDDEPAIQLGAGEYVGKEGTPSVITILRSGPLTAPATVTFTATPGTAVPDRDFTPVSRLVSFVAGQASNTVSVPIRNNTEVHGNRTIMLGLNGPTGGAQLGPRASAVLTIPEDDQGGVVKLSAGAYTVAETAASVVVMIMRTGTNLAGNVSVSYATGNGSALSGLDYTATAGVLTFSAGQASRTISIPILNDTLVEPDETFTFTLSDPTGGATLGSPPAAPVTATVTIKSEDAGGLVKFSAGAYSITEGAGNLSITVVRTGGTASDVTVDYTMAGGTATAGADFQPPAATVGTLTFAAKQTSASIVVPILQDLLAEGNETFTVTLGNPQGGAALGAPAVATVTIVDDEAAIQLGAGEYVGKEGTPSVITILRSGPLTAPATVTFTATPGTAVPDRDFTPVSRLVSFVAGQASNTVSVPIRNNTEVHGNRTIMLGLNGPTGGAQLGPRASAVLTIPEDDQGGVIKLSAGAYTVAEGAGAVVVMVMRTGVNLAGNVSVDFGTFDGTARSNTDGDNDYSGRSGTLTFNAGETSKPITIPILQDTLVEPDETFTVVLSNPTGGATLASSPAVATVATVTIKSDDVASRVKLSAATYRVLEGAGNLSVTVVRSVSLARTVSVDFATDSPAGAGAATADGEDGDYLPTTGRVTFQPNQTTAVITIPIVQDSLAEGDEIFTIMLSNPQGGAVLDPPSSATATIVDDEGVVQFSLRFVGNMPEVVRTGSLATQATVGFASEDETAIGGIDYRPVSGTLTFRAGVASQFIPLLIVPDVLAEGPETFTISLVNPAPEGTLSLGPLSSQTFTITDNDFGGSVQFGTTSVTAAPGESRSIPIVRTGGGGTALVVNWQAISGTSSEAFSPTSGTVIFAANETSKSFTINVSNQDTEGPDVTAVFGLSVAPGAANIGATNTSTLTIFGSRANVNLPLSVYSVVEGGGPAVVSVIRDGGLDRQVSVAYATGNDTALAGRDYTATSGRLTFAPGQEVATFTVPILNNGPSGQTRSLNLTLGSPSPNTFIGEGGNARLQIREAPVFSYRLIADNTGEISGFGGVPSINDGGTVAFRAATTGEDVVVLRGNGGELTTIASVNIDDLLGIDGARFPIDAAGNVVFLGTAGNERPTIFRGSGGALTSLFQTNDGFTGLFDPFVSPGGNVVFGATQSQGGTAIFTGPGGGEIGFLVGAGDEVFDEVGALPSVNDAGVVAFVGTMSEGGGRQLFVGSPGSGDFPVIATGIDTDAFGNLSVNDAGQVAFINGLPAPDQRGILIGQSGSDPTTFVSVANGFQTFGQAGEDSSPIINTLGNVAYLAVTQGGSSGILTGPNPDTSMLIQEGDPLLGSNVAFLRFGGFNAAGQIAFRANLLDGREVIVVGTPTAAASADLSITNVVSVASPPVGSTVTFTLTARNGGPSSAANVQAAQVLPSGYTFVSATPTVGSAVFSQGSVLWTVGNLATGGTATLSVVATVLLTGTYNSIASITTANQFPDPNTTNNTTTVVVTPVLQADIAVAKSVDNATPLVGSIVVFTVTVTNGGPLAATGVQVTDALPSGYTFVTSTPSQGTYVSGTGLWTVGNLGANNSATLQLTTTVRPTGTYTNTATRIASTPTDPDAANNAATVTVTPTTGSP